MARKETRYGPHGYVRRKVRSPLTGDYVAVYGKTVAEREEKIRLLQEEWARQLRREETPYFWEYAAAWYGRQLGDWSPQRRADVAREINSVICPVIGEKLLSEITSGDGAPWSFTAKRRAWDAVTARSVGTVTRRRKDPRTGETVKVDVEKQLGDVIPKHPGVTVTLDFQTTPHNLRRTYITRLILGGVDVRRVQYLAGHESPEITLAIYTSLMGHSPEDLIDDVSAIFPG